MLEGSCLCGAVAFAADLPTLFTAHCHCRWCRRAHGAGFVTWTGVTREAFRFVRGESELRWYRSSRRSRRGFCETCGSTLLFMSSATRTPDEVHIATANIDAGLDREPAAHCFTDQKAEWIELHDALPHLTSDSPELAPYADR